MIMLEGSDTIVAKLSDDSQSLLIINVINLVEFFIKDVSSIRPFELSCEE